MLTTELPPKAHHRMMLRWKKSYYWGTFLKTLNGHHQIDQPIYLQKFCLQHEHYQTIKISHLSLTLNLVVSKLYVIQSEWISHITHGYWLYKMIPIVVLPGTIWSFQVLHRVLYLWQPEAPKKVLWSTFFLRVQINFKQFQEFKLGQSCYVHSSSRDRGQGSSSDFSPAIFRAHPIPSVEGSLVLPEAEPCPRHQLKYD